MTKLTMLVCAGLCAMALVVAANPAQATGSNQVSYVSNTGSDSNTCTNPTTDACASFNHALGQTANDGEIDCVNAGNYGGGFTIAQSVTIDCAGAVGFTPGLITINEAGIVVRLRNLSINGGEVTNFGIKALAMAALYVEHCVITNFGGDAGIEINPSGGSSQIFVIDSVISSNNYGIDIFPGSGAEVNVAIARSKIEKNAAGVEANADGDNHGTTIRATISDSVVSGNLGAGGVLALSSGSTVLVLIDQTDVSGNSYGFEAAGNGAGIVARNTTVFANATGLFSANGAGLISYGNNSVAGNTTNGAFTATVGTQ